MTVREAKRRAAAALSADANPTADARNSEERDAPSPSPELDADCLLQQIMQKNRTWLFLHADEELTAAQQDALSQAVRRRRTGLPVAYITGRKEFYGLDFFVTPDVLIPKPDTEILVERAVELLRERISARPSSVPTVCDVCTGSGCIAIAVLRTLSDDGAIPQEQLPAVVAADISGRALAVARRNAETLLPARAQSSIRFVQSNLLENAAGRYDFILSNPPYIPARTVRSLLSDGRGEPILALDGDVGETGEPSGTNDGLAVIRRLVPQAAANIAPGGALLMEAGEYNARQAAALLRRSGLKGVTIHKDLAGQLRVVEGRR